VRVLIVTIVLLAVYAAGAAAQSTANADEAWSVSAAAATYMLPDDRNYAQPTVTADRAALHLEARYNYEALRTASMWAGYTLSGGQRVQWQVTPMVGGVFGRTIGIAPGYAASLTWRRVDAYIEGEFVFASEPEDRFAYHWSEVAVSPADWLRAGLVTQRTRAYDAERDIQRGPFVNVMFRRIDTAVYVFNPDSEPTVVLSIGWSF
jgi:hypothetical protein